MNYSGMRKITKIDEYIVEMVQLNYHHEWLVYHERCKDQGIYYKTFKEALQSVIEKINY